VDPTLVQILTDGMREYYTHEELRDVCNAFDVDPEIDPERDRLVYHRVAIKLIIKTEHGNNRQLLAALVPSLVNRASDGVAHNDWERRSYHQEMLAQLERLQRAMGGPTILDEMVVPEDRPFSAKSQMREFLAEAETSVTVVDAYVGLGTLDCMRDVEHPIRLLTAQKAQSIERGFDRALKEFVGEGHVIEVKQHPKLHDRYISFNERCWLVGSSLKDAGKKAFNVIEFVDGKEAIASEIEAKWKSAQPYQS
jgi:hypothetical protein